MKAAILPLLLFAAPLPAQDAAPRPALDFGFEERVRSEDWDNIIDHNDAKADYRTHYRFRTRVWATYRFSPDLEVTAGLCNENRKTVRPSTYVYNGREIFFETLFVDYRPAPGLSMRVGRQNIMRGEGFILMDGSSGDGSRSAYLNAAVLGWEAGPSKLEFMAISDPKEDSYLPVINEITDPAQKVRLNEWDERALGVYYTRKAPTGSTLEAYAFLKTERDDYRAPSSALFRPDRRFTTVGGRASWEAGNGWTATAEAAGQWGRQDTAPGATTGARDIAAWGGYARVRKAFDVPWKPRASLGFIGLSGQDPHSARITAWDPVFSRWPKWSELLIYSQVPENGVAYWTNMAMWEAEVRVTPVRNLDLRATFYRLGALEAPAAPGAVFGTGRDRGRLWQVRADVALSPSLKGHALYEHLAPGDFYAMRDGGHFLRFEMAWTFKAHS